MDSFEIVKQIENATKFAEIFPIGGEEAGKIYRELSKKCHPDLFRAEARPRAEEAFKKLTRFYEQAIGKKPPEKPVQIGDWTVLKPYKKGSLSDLYQVVNGKGEYGLLKIAQTAKENPLFEIEAKRLKELGKPSRKEEEIFLRYFPKLLGTFEASGRRANVVSLAENCFPLSELHAQYPKGIPFRHIIWMFNRLLSALWFLHQRKVIHGAVLPNHLLYRPEDHGLVLVDHTCSVKFPSEEHIPLLSSDWKSHYPKEVFKRDAHRSTDIYMAAKAMMFASDTVPRRFQRFFEWCTAESPSARPHDAWSLQEQWKKLAELEFGAPKFVQFKPPLQ